MPIGLPERTGYGGREAENCVRPLLGARQSSVFSVPSRAAVYAQDYAQACAVALSTSDPPRKISKQLFNIAPKIREVDAGLACRSGSGRTHIRNPSGGCILAAQRQSSPSTNRRKSKASLTSRVSPCGANCCSQPDFRARLSKARRPKAPPRTISLMRWPARPSRGEFMPVWQNLFPNLRRATLMGCRWRSGRD